MESSTFVCCLLLCAVYLCVLTTEPLCSNRSGAEFIFGLRRFRWNLQPVCADHRTFM